MQLRGMSDSEIDELNASIRREYNEGSLCLIASEGVLARDWLTSEEDEAWKDLLQSPAPSSNLTMRAGWSR